MGAFKVDSTSVTRRGGQLCALEAGKVLAKTRPPLFVMIASSELAGTLRAGGLLGFTLGCSKEGLRRGLFGWWRTLIAEIAADDGFRGPASRNSAGWRITGPAPLS